MVKFGAMPRKIDETVVTPSREKRFLEATSDNEDVMCLAAKFRGYVVSKKLPASRVKFSSSVL